MHPLLAVFAFAALTLAGDYLLKTGSLRPNPYWSVPTLVGALLYFGTAFGWVYVMRRTNLTVVATAYSSMTIIILTALSLLVFREAVTPRQLLGAGLALAAVLIAMS